MNNLEIYQFSCRSDNYGVLIFDPESKNCVAIDAPEEAAIINALEENNWHLTHIYLTHWHLDHVEGIAGLKQKYQCQVIGPCAEEDKIIGLDSCVADGDRLKFGTESVDIIATPGHTLGMINFHFLESEIVFTGDTLFALGCGRVFEGDGAMMWDSMQKLMVLPPQTQVYCGHEYTLANGKFALTVDPGNTELQDRMIEITSLRERNLPTLPTSIRAELATNPFLRVGDQNIRKELGMIDASDAEVFIEIRRRKDNA